MTRNRLHAVRAGLPIACTVLLAACTGGDGKTLIGGFSLTGEWWATASVGASTCAAESTRVLSPSQGAFLIDQDGESFLIQSEGCCGFTFGGTGSVDGLEVRYHMERSHQPAPGCTLLIQEFGDGRVDGAGIRGEARLIISSSGDCGPGFPCEIGGGFSLDRCVERCQPLCLLPCQAES